MQQKLISSLTSSNSQSSSNGVRTAPTSKPIFFFNHTATTEIYTLSLHDALPILVRKSPLTRTIIVQDVTKPKLALQHQDRKSTRLNSSHVKISYAVFCLKKKMHSIRVLFFATRRWQCWPNVTAHRSSSRFTAHCP